MSDAASTRAGPPTSAPPTVRPASTSDRFSWRDPWRSRAVVLDAADVDTDRIIPARFLTGTTRVGLGAHLFADWGVLPDGSPRPGFPLDSARRILVTGRNFGCGSSREHAAWALVDHGFRAVVAPSFGDIFRANALKNGLLPVALDLRDWAAIEASLATGPDREIEVDLEAQLVRFGDRNAPFPIDPFARHCLLEGVDELGFLLAREPLIARYEGASPWTP